MVPTHALTSKFIVRLYEYQTPSRWDRRGACKRGPVICHMVQWPSPPQSAQMLLSAIHGKRERFATVPLTATADVLKQALHDATTILPRLQNCTAQRDLRAPDNSQHWEEGTQKV